MSFSFGDIKIIHENALFSYLSISLSIYLYIYNYIHIYLYLSIYMYIDRYMSTLKEVRSSRGHR